MITSPVLIAIVTVSLFMILIIKKRKEYLERELDREVELEVDGILAEFAASPCTGLIEVSGYDSSQYLPTDSVIQFDSDVVLRQVWESDINILDDTGKIQYWIEQGDPSNKAPSSPPATIERFHHTSFSLLTEKQGRVRCGACNQTYEATELVYTKFKSLSIGWNYDCIECPNGHLISRGNGLHVYGTSSSE